MNFSYTTAFGIESPDASERLIADCMMGDSTLFIRRDEVEAAWRIIAYSVINAWKNMPPNNIHRIFCPGTWGPEEADALIEKDGRRDPIYRVRGGRILRPTIAFERDVVEPCLGDRYPLAGTRPALKHKKLANCQM